MCTKPPACVLFKPVKAARRDFENLYSSLLPIFPLERSITVKGFLIRRKQVLICPAFCLTNYKVHGSTLTSTILDLKDDLILCGLDRHRKYCSTYVQLSWLRSFTGLYKKSWDERSPIYSGSPTNIWNVQTPTFGARNHTNLGIFIPMIARSLTRISPFRFLVSVLLPLPSNILPVQSELPSFLSHQLMLVSFRRFKAHACAAGV
jgi:hypothetical protein